MSPIEPQPQHTKVKHSSGTFAPIHRPDSSSSTSSLTICFGSSSSSVTPAVLPFPALPVLERLDGVSPSLAFPRFAGVVFGFGVASPPDLRIVQ